jgi:hypothetical protein
MSETLGGGLKVSGYLSRAERLLKSDQVLASDFDRTVAFVRRVRDSEIASDKERLKAAEILIGVIARGDKLASDIAAEERIDGGKASGRNEIVVEIRMDDAG